MESVLTKALENGDEKLFNELRNKIEGQQGRLNALSTTQTQATQMATADHSLLEQLFNNNNRLCKIINYNSRKEKELIDQLQDVHINGYELLKALENECGTTVDQMIKKIINEKTIQSINDVLNDIDKEKIEIQKSTNALSSKISDFQSFFKFGFVGLIFVSAIPLWWFKILFGIVLLIGGYYFDKK
ncbi:hypothetical protein [Companilactobacillus sp. HBUAS59699]|uniref:hypothetical protein n=1 Tax=Companilactobacillus sp. HBUAS59699 TaxID=3109358 RepID=UPI002FF28DA8